MKDAKGYFDVGIDLDDLLTQTAQGGGVDDYFYLKDLQHRRLYLTEDIDENIVNEVIQNIFRFNMEDRGKAPESREPIILYLSSHGGEVEAGLELIDAIEASITPVYTVTLGVAYSMGLYISIAGHKRYALKNAKYLMHDGSSGVWDSSAKAQDRMEFVRRIDSRLKAHVIAHSNVTEDEYDSKLRIEWYLFADEAKEKGFVDYIVGVDCDLDEVI